MGDKILAILSIASGTALISIWIISNILNFLKGRKVLNGKIIGIDHEKQSLMIRYKIGKETYNEIEYRKSSCFLSNKIPKIGLKVSVIADKDDLFQPLSVVLATKMMIGSETGYTHTSRLLGTLRLAGLGSVLIIGGILILTGIF